MTKSTWRDRARTRYAMVVLTVVSVLATAMVGTPAAQAQVAVEVHNASPDASGSVVISGITGPGGIPQTLFDLSVDFPQFDPQLGLLVEAELEWDLNGTVGLSATQTSVTVTASNSFLSTATSVGAGSRTQSFKDGVFLDVAPELVGVGRTPTETFTYEVTAHSGSFPAAVSADIGQGGAPAEVNMTYYYVPTSQDVGAPMVDASSLNLEATGPTGAVVVHTATAVDDFDNFPGQTTANCVPGNGLFPLGTTAVQCQAVDFAGNVGTTPITVTVVDTTPPVITNVPSSFTQPQTSLAGATVSYAAPTATDTVSSATVECLPVSGSIFPAGETVVHCTAADAAGNSSDAAFTVTVMDTTAPVLSMPAVVSVEAMGPQGASVFLPFGAVDAVAGPIAPSCSPGDGVYPIGRTEVTCTATDPAGNTSTGTSQIDVEDTTPPLIYPAVTAVSESATSASGAVVTFALPTATDRASTPSIACSPASGSLFPIGTTSVLCTAIDAAGLQATATINVTVVDTILPVISLPPAIDQEATSLLGAEVLLPVTANDGPGVPLTANCAPGNGQYPLGSTPVTCTATDTAGNAASASTVVTIRDTTPPMLVGVPGPISRDATSSAGLVIDYPEPTASDIASIPTVRCVPASGSTFIVGSTTVTCTANDGAGLQATQEFDVMVHFVDVEPPEIDAVPDINAQAFDSSGVAVNFELPAATDNDGIPAVQCDPMPGSVFEVGTTTVICTATDTSGNSAQTTFDVHVSDPRSGRVLMVVGSVNSSGLAPGRDRPVVSLLEDLGFEVQLVDDDQVMVEDAGLVELVAVSSSVVPSKVGDLFADIALPVVTWEGYLFDEFGFVAGNNGETSTTQRQLDIMDAAHPISAGYENTTTVTTESLRFAYAQPVVGADIIAEAGGQAVVFAFEDGASLAQGTAPARRVGLFMNYVAAGRLTQAGRDIVAAAIGWATETDGLPGNSAPVVDAGANDSVFSGGAVDVALDANVADDGRPIPPGQVTTLWSAENPAVVFADAAAVDTTVSLPGPGTYVLTLLASDSVLATEDSVTITVVEPSNTPPTVDAGMSRSIELPTRSVALDATVTDDGLPLPASLTVAWSQFSGPPGVTFDEPGEIDAVANFPGAGQYVLQLSVSDGDEVVVENVTVNVDAATPDDGVVVAFVASRTDPLPSGDRPIESQILATGASVIRIDDDALLDDYGNFDLIWLSTSVVYSKIEDHFADVPVPLITTEQYLFDDLNIAAPAIGARTSASIRIQTEGHELAASTTGTVTITDVATALGYGQPGPGATIVASAGGQPVFFAYEADAEMIGAVRAPARRVAFPGTFTTPKEANTNYRNFVAAALAYALAPD